MTQKKTTTKKDNSRLGRGLSALIAQGSSKKDAPRPPKKAQSKKATTTPAKEAPAEHSPYQEVPLDLVDKSPYQPRMEIDPKHIDELAASIRAEGLLQPIVVRKVGKKFELIAGERRFRACQKLKMKTISARIIEASNASAAVLSLIENLQRENLNPVDEAMGYSSLMRDFDLTQEDVAQRVGKGRATIANSLRLVQLEQEIQGYLSKGMISVGHAKVLLSLQEPAQRMILARRIIEMGMSVREAERMVLKVRNDAAAQSMPRPVSSASTQSAVIEDLQKQVSRYLTTAVSVKHGAKKGKLVIEYNGNDDLHRILEKIGFASAHRTTTAA